MKKGVFITFEGPEGSGKSTQSRLLCDFLKESGYNLYHTREPGGTLIGEKIRKILLDVSHDKMARLVELLLYEASRNQLIEECIKPQLNKGKIVVCDRFSDATVAYQGYGLNVDKKLIHSLNNLVTTPIKPNLTILLDIKPKEAMARTNRYDRIEKRSLVFHKKVYRGYLELAKKEPRRIKVIPALGTVTETQNLIRQVVLDVIKRYKVPKSRVKTS